MINTLNGPACLTCREKCRKCDRARPKCNRCTSKGLVCRGYPEQFRFCGIASRGKWKGARTPASSKSARAQSTRPEFMEGNSDSSPKLPRTYTKPKDDPGLTKSLPENAVISEILSFRQTKTLLTHYDQIICPHQIAEVGDNVDNPYRAYILPLANEHIGLLYAVLGLSAAHLGKLNDDTNLYEATAVEYRMRAIRALGQEIRNSQSISLPEDQQDAVLATIQILLLHDIAESGISTHGIHITGAVSVCKLLLLSDGLNGRRQRAVFFLGNLAWLDIIRAFAGAERLCFTQEIREMVACEGDHKFELVNGCPREIFLIIGNVLDKAKEHLLGWVTWDEFEAVLLLAKQRLYSWDRRSKTYPSSDPRWQCVAEAFQFACILHILRLLNQSQPASHTAIQEAVNRILDATAAIPMDCTLVELLILPLFIAGADSLSTHSQYYVLSRFREIEQRSGFRNPAPGDLLQKVWAARSAQSPGDDSNISWMNFTHSPELTRQHDFLII